MKFLRLFLSAVRRPPIRLTIKTCLSSNVRPGANTVGPILYDVYYFFLEPSIIVGEYCNMDYYIMVP